MPSPSAFRDTQSILERFFTEGAYQKTWASTPGTSTATIPGQTPCENGESYYNDDEAKDYDIRIGSGVAGVSEGSHKLRQQVCGRTQTLGCSSILARGANYSLKNRGLGRIVSQFIPLCHIPPEKSMLSGNHLAGSLRKRVVTSQIRLIDYLGMASYGDVQRRRV